MLEGIVFEELKYFANLKRPPEIVTMHYGGKIREGTIHYIEKEDLFYLQTKEGKIEICDGEKIKMGKNEYITRLK